MKKKDFALGILCGAMLFNGATAMAAGRGPWLKSSATMNQGMGPGPISKKATKPKMATMEI